MLQRPSFFRSAAALLAGGDVAPPPPDATSATACPPHAVATPSSPEARRQAAREWYYLQFDVIEDDIFETIDDLERRDPDALVRLHEIAIRKDARASAERTARVERPIVAPAISSENWSHDPFVELDDSIAAASLAVWTMAVIAAAVLAAFAVTLLAIGGVL